MARVFLLQHSHALPSGQDDVKIIGIYSTRIKAEQAVARLAKVPGFQDYPQLLDPSVDPLSDGFFIDEFLLDTDRWREGYVTF
jgi:hypothetical protein